MTARARFGELVRAAGGAVKVAPQLGCSRAYVDMIIAGRRSPGMKVAYATEHWAKSSIDDLVEHWLRAHELFTDDRRHIERLLVLRYEDLVADPAHTLARVDAFCGLRKRIVVPLPSRLAEGSCRIENATTPVHVNRILHEKGFLRVQETSHGQLLDCGACRACASTRPLTFRPTPAARRGA